MISDDSEEVERREYGKLMVFGALGAVGLTAASMTDSRQVETLEQGGAYHHLEDPDTAVEYNIGLYEALPEEEKVTMVNHFDYENGTGTEMEDLLEGEVHELSDNLSYEILEVREEEVDLEIYQD